MDASYENVSRITGEEEREEGRKGEEIKPCNEIRSDLKKRLRSQAAFDESLKIATALCSREWKRYARYRRRLL